MAGVKGFSGPPGNTNAKGNRGGRPPKNNANAARHGVHAYLRHGTLPSGPIKQRVESIEAELCKAVEQTHGEIGIEAALTVESACRAEACCLLMLQYRVELQGELKKIPDQHHKRRSAVLDRIFRANTDVVRFTAHRDAAVAKLELSNGKANDPWAAIYAQPLDALPAPQDTPQRHDRPQDVPDAKPAQQNATHAIQCDLPNDNAASGTGDEPPAASEPDQ